MLITFLSLLKLSSLKLSTMACRVKGMNVGSIPDVPTCDASAFDD